MNECIFVGEQASDRDCSSYLKGLGFQKLNLGIRQTSHHFIVSHAFGQISLLQGQGLWLKNLRCQGMGSNKRRESYQKTGKMKELHCRFCCLFSKSRIIQIPPVVLWHGQMKGIKAKELYNNGVPTTRMVILRGRK